MSVRSRPKAAIQATTVPPHHFVLQSGLALATVVGFLVEVPVMLSVVWIVNRSRRWYEAKA